MKEITEVSSNGRNSAYLWLKEGHQSKTSYKYMIWHINEKVF